MNQKTAKLIRKQLRAYLKTKDKQLPERLLVIFKTKHKVIELAGQLNEDGTVKKIEYTVHTAANSKDSVRGHYRAMKKLMKKDKQR